MVRSCNVIFISILILALAFSGCGGGKGGGPTTYVPGQSVTYTVGGISFNMNYAPNASFTSNDSNFPGDPYLPGTVTVANAYWIAETEVTYELWHTVRLWAIDADRETDVYTFANLGREGYDGIDGDNLTDASQEPVTMISWRDAMIWCNALTEYYNEQNGTSLSCVYKLNGTPIRNATEATTCDTVVPDTSAKGFRLPTSNEWQLAARYQDGTSWTPGNHVSGDTTGSCNPDDTDTSTVFGNYAWYRDISGSSTHPVGKLTANALKLRDMSGNVWEWCFDLYGDSDSERVDRGGGFGDQQYFLQLKLISYESPDFTRGIIGFRPVRTE